jgi:arabinose-5-phosphate isomerase
VSQDSHDAQNGRQSDALSHARRVLREEADALLRLAERLDGAFAAAADHLLGCRGRVVVTGMGKSGIVGRKITATLASTGTPALFLHPAEAVHGDLGMAAEGDVVLALSYSGETDELLAILPGLKRRTRALIAVTGGTDSTLARAADVVLDVAVPREADTHNLAPTASTTAMMALGDALAVAVMEARGFRRDDYALLHPAGSLGRRLLLRVADVMRTGDSLAVVGEAATLHEAMFAITRAQAGAACVVDERGRLSGILTDGDARRFLVKRDDPHAWDRPVAEAMTRAPHVANPHQLAVEAFEGFERGGDRVRVGDLPVVSEDGQPVGMLTLKDVVRAGVLPPDGGGADA